MDQERKKNYLKSTWLYLKNTVQKSDRNENKFQVSVGQ